MTSHATTSALLKQQAYLERRAEQNARQVEAALRAFYEAVQRHGDGSAEALKAEEAADAAFWKGEEIAADLLKVEAALSAMSMPIAA